MSHNVLADTRYSDMDIFEGAIILPVHPLDPKGSHPSHMKNTFIHQIPTSPQISTCYNINSKVSNLIIQTTLSKSGKDEVLGLIHICSPYVNL